MHRTKPWMRAGPFALLLLVATAGDCPTVGEPAASKYPPKAVAGNWVGEMYGVRFKLTLTESGRPDVIFNSTVVAGNGWLVYGTTPAESVAVEPHGYNNGGPNYGISLEFRRPNGTGGVYGNYSGARQDDATLLGPFERLQSLEPNPSPWTNSWPAGTTAGTLRLTRQ